MVKKFYSVLLIVLFLSCKKDQPQGIATGYNIENYRKAGMNDYQTIIAACDSLPENSVIVFSNKTYTLNHTPIIEKSFQFTGPATFKREDQITYELKGPATESSTYLVLSSTKDLMPGDRIEICINTGINGATPINVVTYVYGDTILLSKPVGETFGGAGNYSQGTTVFKSINFFWILSPTKYTDLSCSFYNLTFDGNRDNNKGSFFWDINSSIVAITKGATSYKDCIFLNSPNETIVGHNANIQNCTFHNLNGSGIHTSADKVNCTEDEIHSYFYDNTFENTNQISTTITGHSEGAITHSNSGGYYTASGNTFINVGESVLGALYPSSSIDDWGTSDITFTDNTINGAGRMVYLIDTVHAGIIHDVKIEKNTISNLKSQNWAIELNYWPGIILRDKSDN